jgi:hypothetical protein
VQELDLRRETRPVQRPDQVGREHEAALQHRDHEQVLRSRRRDVARDLLVALGDGRLVEQDADAGRAGHSPRPDG